MSPYQKSQWFLAIMIKSNSDHGIIWSCGFDDISIEADFDIKTELWTYRVLQGDISLTTRITSPHAPHEESSRGRDSKIKKALNMQRTYGGDVDNVLMSLAEFGVCLENDDSIIKKHVTTKVSGAHEDTKSPQHIIDEATDILLHGDPIQFILDTFDTIHRGDVETAELLLVSIATQSIENSKGIQPGVNGESGKGKSHVCETMLHLIPAEFWINTSLSAKVIYYLALGPGVIIFSDDVTIGEDLESTIKRATSNFQKTTMHTTIDANRNVIELVVPQRLCWWLASVSPEMSAQAINRQFGVNVDESQEMDDIVAKHQLDKAVSGEVDFPITDDVLVCREIMREIKESLFIVTIPFANDIVWTQNTNRRNLPIFLDMVRSFAVLRFRQRERLGDNILVATKEDFYSAVALYCRRAETQTTKLTDAELVVVRALAQYGEMDIKTLQKVIGKPESTIRVMLHGRDGKSGMLEKLPVLFRENVTCKIDDARTVKKYVYGVSQFDQLGSYEGMVYLSNNGDAPPKCIEHDEEEVGGEWDIRTVKSSIHAYMTAASGTSRYMSDSGFFQISTELKELGAPDGLVESTIEHYKQNPMQ